MTAQVTIGERTYTVGKMNAEDQFHVLRRVMPLVKPILESLKLGIGFNPLMLVQISEDLASLSDEQLNYVLHKCMDVITVQAGGSAPIKLRVNGRYMFADIDLPIMMQLTWAVLMENFRPFLTRALDGPSNVEPQTSETS